MEDKRGHCELLSPSFASDRCDSCARVARSYASWAREACPERRYESKSVRPRSSYLRLRLRPAPPVGGHVHLHYANDDSAGSDHMGRSSGRRSFAPIMECVPCLCRSVVLVWDAETRQEHLLTMHRLDRAG